MALNTEGPGIPMADVFLSYSHKDLDWATEIAVLMESKGLTVWWDRLIKPGASFAGTINEQAMRANCIFVIWSDISCASRWVQAEALYGFETDKLTGAKLSEISLPIPFNIIQYVIVSTDMGLKDEETRSKIVTAASANLAAPHAKEVCLNPDDEFELIGLLASERFASDKSAEAYLNIVANYLRAYKLKPRPLIIRESRFTDRSLIESLSEFNNKCIIVLGAGESASKETSFVIDMLNPFFVAYVFSNWYPKNSLKYAKSSDVFEDTSGIAHDVATKFNNNVAYIKGL